MAVCICHVRKSLKGISEQTVCLGSVRSDSFQETTSRVVLSSTNAAGAGRLIVWAENDGSVLTSSQEIDEAVAATKQTQSLWIAGEAPAAEKLVLMRGILTLSAPERGLEQGMEQEASAAWLNSKQARSKLSMPTMFFADWKPAFGEVALPPWLGSNCGLQPPTTRPINPDLAVSFKNEALMFGS